MKRTKESKLPQRRRLVLRRDVIAVLVPSSLRHAVGGRVQVVGERAYGDSEMISCIDSDWCTSQP
jgi:hypothetical protein